MEIFTINPDTLELVDYIDKPTSFIWTEKYNELGDVKLILPWSAKNEAILTPLAGQEEVFITHSKTNRIAVLHTIVKETDDNNVLNLTATGADSLYILNFRIAWKDLDMLGSSPKWTRTSAPKTLIDNSLSAALIATSSGVIMFNIEDKIPLLAMGSDAEIPAGDLPWPGSVTIETTQPMSTWAYIQQIAKAYDLGLRIYMHNGGLYYRTYVGNDHTSASSNEATRVIFSPKFDNLKNISELRSTKEYIKATLLWSTNTRTSVGRPGTPAGVGWARRWDSLVVSEANGLTTTAQRDAYLQQKGREHLNEVNKLLAMDGQITKLNNYVYNVDFLLGDKVDLASGSGVVTRCRVSAYTFVADQEGVRDYPTFELKETVLE